MADSGSFNAEAELTLQVSLDNTGLVELTKTIKEISKGKDLQRYWKDIETATDNAVKAMKRYSRNTESEKLAGNLIKEINALKALTGKENLSELFPNIDLNFEELIISAKKIVPKINSEFSVENFSQAFNTFELLKSKGIDLENVFAELANYSKILDKNLKLNSENIELKEIIGDNNIEEIKEKISEIKKLRDQAEETFESFLNLNNIDKSGIDSDGWYTDNRFEKYFEMIRNGTLSAKDAIISFKSEYAYLLEESFKSNNNNFGLEQLLEFSNKLDTIFHKVEETSSKINDIISNGVIEKSIENLSFSDILNDEESLKSITSLFQKMIEDSKQTSKIDLFNDEQLQQVLSIFDKIEGHLKSLRSIISDVGDGEELSPLLKMLDSIRNETSNIKLSFNMDLGDEVSARFNQKVSQATARQLEAYRNLFSAMKKTGKTNKEMLKFFEPDDTSATELIGMYKGVIERAEKQFKVGRGSIYKKYLGSEYDALKKEITNANKQLTRADSKRSESGILGDLFGNTKDLSEVISQLNVITDKLESIASFIPEFKNAFKNGINVSNSVEEIEKLTNKVKELEEELSKIKTGNTNQNKQKDKEDKKLFDERDSKIENFRKKSADFLIKPDEVHRLKSWKDEIDNLNRLIDEYAEKAKYAKDNSLADNNTIAELNSLENKIKDMITTMNKVPQGNRGFTDISVSNAMEKINATLGKFSGISSTAKRKIKALYDELSSGNLTMPVSGYIDEVNRLIQTERRARRAHKSFVEIFKEKVVYGAAGQLAGLFGFNDVINFGKQAIDTIVELDTALLDLKKTTAMSSSQLEDFYFDANDVAKQMGVTTKEIIDQASAWSRLGYNTKEASTQMAQLSSQFASISPGMDVDTAQEGLVSIMKAWNIDVSDVESEIMDNINALGNSMAEDNQDIVEGMKRSAAALASVGTSYEDAFAMFSGIQEVLQNAEVSGRALRSISMRIRGYDESTEAKSDDLKNITGELINLTKTAKHAEGISIFKEGSKTEFKSLVEYFGEINKIWDEMSQKQQNDFLQTAFGKTQAQAGAALIQNYDAVVKSLEVMEESAGSADKEMEVVEQSLSYKINALGETWVGTFQNLIDRGDLGIIIDSLTKLSEAIGFVVDKLGLFGTAGVIGGGILGAHGLGLKLVYKPIYIRLCNNAI